MWHDIEGRINENEAEQPVARRWELFKAFRDFGLRPGSHATKYMVSFAFGKDERLLWELTGKARNVFLHVRWQPIMEKAGFDCDPRPYVDGQKDGGRHSALSRSWSFDKDDCFAVTVETPEALKKVLAMLSETDAPLTLKPEAVDRWIERLKHFFPDFERFDKPDPEFDRMERDYKIETMKVLRDGLNAAQTDQAVADAVLNGIKRSNLLNWRTYTPLTAPKNVDQPRLWSALAVLIREAEGDPVGHPDALQQFVQDWVGAVADGSADHARQIAEFLFLHLAPNDGIYIRHTIREKFWQEAVGSPFPTHESMADTYRDELRFMQAVQAAVAKRGLAPRDMIDVQSALWVVHSYKDQNPEGQTSHSLTRDTIEGAMDAFDEYRVDGEYSEIFGEFGDPRDYWVRSTRSRETRVFPSKPIVGYVKNRKILNGGWGQKSDAAASLHNAGFIIVDANDAPVAPPTDKAFLLKDADRIRLCALNYYILPAREKGQASVSIRIGTVNNDLMLGQGWANVFQALKGQKFQEMANVPPPRQDGADAGPATTLTFELTASGAQDTMTENVQRTPTNLILYGPPGTGKTYATAFEAVRLCHGDDFARDLPEPDRRAKVMDAYQALVRDGRVEFITFHQSFSYEDFVEGLRPTTALDAETADAETDQPTAGFSLKPHEGVFKRISERARKDSGPSGGVPRLDRSRAVFKVSLGRRGTEEDRIRLGLDHGLVHLGWGKYVDWSDPRFDEKSEILREWRTKEEPDAGGYGGHVKITASFRSEMQVDDYVVISDGRDRFRAFGRVLSDYRFEQGAEFHPHRRDVEWIWRKDDGEDRSSFYPKGFRQSAVYKLNSELIDWDALEEIVLGDQASRPPASAPDYVLIIDEINRANISKVFGELITLLEPDKRLGAANELRVRLPYSGKSFGVPANLHIIGTMNTADRSIALLDTALRRRFTFRELMPDPEKLPPDVDGIDLQRLLTTLNARIEYLFDREHQIGHAYFMGCRSRADVEAVIRDNVIPLLAEYFYDDWAKIAAVMDGRRLDAEGAPHEGGFLRAEALRAPGFEGLDADMGARLRWSVKEAFDFAEFEG